MVPLQSLLEAAGLEEEGAKRFAGALSCEEGLGLSAGALSCEEGLGLSAGALSEDEPPGLAAGGLSEDEPPPVLPPPWQCLVPVLLSLWQPSAAVLPPWP